MAAELRRSVGALALWAVVLACSSSNSGVGGPKQVSATETITFATQPNNRVDLLFVIVDWASTSDIQQKFGEQLPAFMNVLQSSPNPLDLHVAIVTPDMGAPSDVVSSFGGGCVPPGDDGVFQNTPRGTCTSTGLANGATYLSVGNGVANFTGDLGTTLQCLALLGNKGCGFGQPLAALDRALGADRSPAPAANAGFLRDDAYLAIVLLADQDDCSAPSNTQLFSLDVGGSNQQNIANALGPIDHYRCNRYGHLCKDPSGQTVMPPLVPPAGATTLDLTDCTSNDTSSGLLTPVNQFITDIKSLKPDPDNQIVVSAILGPVTPYTVAWVTEQNGQNTQPGELWPQVEHSCGAVGGDNVNPEATQNATDGSQGDPGVRLDEFVHGFSNGLVASVCDPSYVNSMTAIATKVGALPGPPCLTGTIQQNASGLPDCAVTAYTALADGTTETTTYQNCAVTGNVPPCWSLGAGQGTCTGQTVNLLETSIPSTSVSVTCSLCEPGISAPGC